MSNRQKKVINVTSYSYCSVDPTAVVPWDDVWIKFHCHKSRKIIKLGPTVIGSESFIEDHFAITLRCLWKYDKGLRRTNKDGHSFMADLEHDDEIKKQFARGAEFIIDIPDGPHGAGIPSIICLSKCINRATIEKALKFLLTQWNYLKPGTRLKFHWKAPKIFCIPCR
jgi:hypothetical protein